MPIQKIVLHKTVDSLSQMLSDMFPLCRHVTLKPSVGFTSSFLHVPDVTWARIVLFPALSNPRTIILFSGLSSNCGKGIQIWKKRYNKWPTIYNHVQLWIFYEQWHITCDFNTVPSVVKPIQRTCKIHQLPNNSNDNNELFIIQYLWQVQVDKLQGTLSCNLLSKHLQTLRQYFLGLFSSNNGTLYKHKLLMQSLIQISLTTSQSFHTK